jgi:hypothetical protein
MPVVITATAPHCDVEGRQQIDLVYSTNRDQMPRRVTATPNPNGDIVVELPPQPSPTAVYYYFEATAVVKGQSARTATPPEGAADPFSIVVSRDHLTDLDIDGRALDVYDIVRMMRHLAWHEALPHADELDFDDDHAVTESDLRRAASLIVQEYLEPAKVTDRTVSVSFGNSEATVEFVDGSALTVPRMWSGKITDLILRTQIVDANAALLVSRSRSLAGSHATRRPTAGGADGCLTMTGVAANRTPNRRLPHELRRFMALSWDNIQHDPLAYLVASATRAVRVFVIAGSEDVRTAYQFSGAGRVYAIGRAVSVLFLALAAAGVWIARAKGFRVLLLLAPILYVPLTICFMLINARYSMTMQPFMFAFVATALVTALDALTPSRDRAVQSR